MRKEKMVTRTMVSTVGAALLINVETAEPFNEPFTIPGFYENIEKLEKEVRELIKDEKVRLAAVVEYHKEENLYGMPESTFLKYATVLPPRNQENE